MCQRLHCGALEGGSSSSRGGRGGDGAGGGGSVEPRAGGGSLASTAAAALLCPSLRESVGGHKAHSGWRGRHSRSSSSRIRSSTRSLSRSLCPSCCSCCLCCCQPPPHCPALSKGLQPPLPVGARLCKGLWGAVVPVGEGPPKGRSAWQQAACCLHQQHAIEQGGVQGVARGSGIARQQGANSQAAEPAAHAQGLSQGDGGEELLLVQVVVVVVVVVLGLEQGSHVSWERQGGGQQRQGRLGGSPARSSASASSCCSSSCCCCLARRPSQNGLNAAGLCLALQVGGQHVAHHPASGHSDKAGADSGGWGGRGGGAAAAAAATTTTSPARLCWAQGEPSPCSSCCSSCCGCCCALGGGQGWGRCNGSGAHAAMCWGRGGCARGGLRCSGSCCGTS